MKANDLRIWSDHPQPIGCYKIVVGKQKKLGPYTDEEK